MSNSSSSDDDESRFRKVCDPTFWRTATEGGAEDSTNFSVQAFSPQHHHSYSSDRQSFLLLQKIKATLDASQRKTASPRVGCEGSGTHRRRPWMVDASIGSVAAPSTLSTYLAKQLVIRLDRSMGYYFIQDPAPASQECYGTNQQSFHLLKNLSLIHQESETEVDIQRRKSRVKVPKRLTYYTSSDEEELKTRCSSVAVSPEWILAGGVSFPRPHPKNVRYIDEYKVKEHKSDGSIIAVPCSALDSTVTTKNLIKRKEKKYVTENKKDCVLYKKGKVPGFADSVDTVKHLNSNVKTQRKQARKRGKKKKNKENSEVSAA